MPVPQYTYVARSEAGKIERGEIAGATPAEVQAVLRQRGQQLVGIEPLNRPTSGAWKWAVSFATPQRITLRSAEGELLLHQLAAMLASGLELTPSLKELAEYAPKPRIRNLCNRLSHAVEEGSTFSAALLQFSSFPPVVAKLAHVGEETGELPVTLKRAADFLEKRRQTIGSLFSALAYPVVVAIAACSVAAYLVGWAIPKLATFLHAMGRTLPSMTQSLIDLSRLVQTYGPLFTVLMISSLTALALLYLSKPGRYGIDRILLRLPLVGRLLQMAETQQLASSLALMLRSGVLLQDALDTAASLHRNHFLADRVRQQRMRIARGQGLTQSFGDAGFAPMLRSMVGVGEKTGDLPNALEHVANFYATQVDTSIKRMARLIEPAIILFVGGMVGYVYVAFFMALLSTGGNFK